MFLYSFAFWFVFYLNFLNFKITIINKYTYSNRYTVFFLLLLLFFFCYVFDRLSEIATVLCIKSVLNYMIMITCFIMLQLHIVLLLFSSAHYTICKITSFKKVLYNLFNLSFLFDLSEER